MNVVMVVIVSRCGSDDVEDGGDGGGEKRVR